MSFQVDLHLERRSQTLGALCGSSPGPRLLAGQSAAKKKSPAPALMPGPGNMEAHKLSRFVQKSFSTEKYHHAT